MTLGQPAGSRWRRPWALALAAAFVMAVFFALIGPFGSYADPFPKRLASSLIYSLGGVAIWGPGYPLLLRLGARWPLPELAVRLGAALVISAPVAGLAVVLARLIWRPAHPQSVFVVYGEVVSVVVPLALAAYALRRWDARRTAAPAPSLPVVPPRLLSRLPPALGAEILALEAEDHYVRVHTARGSTLILARFADLVDELDGLPGLQVHRSWWVARTAVAGASVMGRRAELVLTNGVVAPVARTAIPEARAQGLLAVRA